MTLSGRVALITGGVRGVGAATALYLSQTGVKVHVADLDGIGAEEAPDLAAAVSGYHHLDVTRPDAWDLVIAEIRKQEGRLDILHLNAGIQARPIGKPVNDDPLLWLDEGVVDRLVAVNIKGVTNGIIKCLPLLRESRGTIIVTASLAGVFGYADDPLYAMTKHAVVGLVRSLAPRLEKEDICIGAVCPGGISTRMCPPDGIDESVRLIEPADIAEIVGEMISQRDCGAIMLAPADGDVRRFDLDLLAP